MAYRFNPLEDKPCACRMKDDSDSDSDSSSSSSKSIPTEQQTTLVLDLHDIKKGCENTMLAKVKKLRKKKKSARNHSQSSGSSSSPSETTNASKTDTALDKFYDAQGSLHALPENPIVNQKVATQPVAVVEIPVTQPQLPVTPDLKPPIQTTITLARSEHGPKTPSLGTTPQSQTQSAIVGRQQAVSPIIKPTTLPDQDRPK